MLKTLLRQLTASKRPRFTKKFDTERIMWRTTPLVIVAIVVLVLPVSRIMRIGAKAQGQIATYYTTYFASVNKPDPMNPNAHFVMGWVPIDANGNALAATGTIPHLIPGMSPNGGLFADDMYGNLALFFSGSLTGYSTATGTYNTANTDYAAWLYQQTPTEPLIGFFAPTYGSENWLYGVGQPPQNADCIAIFPEESLNTSGSPFAGNTYGTSGAYFSPTLNQSLPITGTSTTQVNDGGNFQVQFQYTLIAYVDAYQHMYFGYAPPGAGPTPSAPQSLNLNVTSQANTVAEETDSLDLYLASSISATASATDSFGDSATVSGATSPGTIVQKLASNRQLVSAPVEDNIAKLTMTGSTTRTLNVGVPYMTQNGTDNPTIDRVVGLADANVWAFAFPDSRTVKLTRPGAVGEIVDSGGVTHGDTLYSYNLGMSVATDMGPVLAWTPTLVWNDFASSYIGSWTMDGSVPLTTWSWTPNESNDTQFSGPVSSPQGTMNINEGTNQYSGVRTTTGQNQYTIVYTAQDQSDLATAKASYVLKFHDPIENLNDNQTNQYVNAPLVGLSPFSGQSGLIYATGPLSAGEYTVTTGTDTTSGWYLEFNGGDIAEAMLDPILQTTGLNAGYNQSTTHSISQSLASPALAAGQYCVAYMQDAYTRHDLTFRHFKENGEHQLTDSAGNPVMHELAMDVYWGSTLIWGPVIPISFPHPSTTGPFQTIRPSPSQP